MINTDKVKGRMKEKRITQKMVADKLGIAQPTANQKINNIRPMTLSEAEILSSLLEIAPEEFGLYFFLQ
ncbi:MAG: helix-turn-helix transcriptional regulator [Clostridiales bacterium]|nr:helix-turn-helix transcriptional regulator [Clostridiales bacterium]